MDPYAYGKTASAAALALALVVVPGLPAPAAAQADRVEIEEWDVPWTDSRPRDPYVGPDGRVWFVGQVSHYVAALDPTSGDFERFDLPDGAGPHNLIVDDEGTIWYAGNRVANIGELDPETGEIVEHAMPDEAARDPHTLVFDGEGGIWFTVQGGNFIGHFDMEDGATELIQAPQAESRGRMGSSRPYGIKLDSNGHPWIALFNTNHLATVDPESMELNTVELPEGARPRRLVVDSRDNVWYVDYARGKLGRYEPETDALTEWDNPGGADSRPYGMAIDAADRIWFVETGSAPNRFVGFDAATESFISVTDVGGPEGAIRHMFYDASEDVVWFGTDWDTVGRATLPPTTGRVVSQVP
jgi:virginiamycin B lyase